MFRKLRNNFILTTMALLTTVIVVSFAVIYIGTTSDFRGDRLRQPFPIGLQTNSLSEQQLRTFVDEQRQEHANRLALTLILTGLATLIAGYFISRYIADRAIKPVREAYEKQKQFITDASHELKTPLAVIDASIEAELSDRKGPSKWLKNIQAETGRMNALVKDLLTLAKFDVANGALPVSFDIGKTTDTVLESFTPLIEKKSLRLTKSVETSLVVTGHEDKVRQIISILVDNAVKYTGQNGTIDVSSSSTNGGTEIVVSNSHRPFPAKQLSRLFERFYQTDVSHRSEGYGLGLAIAKAVSDSIGAELSVSQKQGVISFRLFLPLIQRRKMGTRLE